MKSRIGEKMICHLDIASIALHKDSEEAKQQIQREDGVYDGISYFIIFIENINNMLIFLNCLLRW